MDGRAQEVSRRDFLQGLGALGLADLMPGALAGRLFSAGQPPAAPYRDPLPERSPGLHSQKVIVVGAGLAGLSATRNLVTAGHQVTVLEARSRPGGRIHTLRDSFPGPLYCEAGAKLFRGPHIQELLDELNLELQADRRPTYDLHTLYFLGDKRIRMTDNGLAGQWPLDLTEEERELGLTGIKQKYLDSLAHKIGDPRADGWPPERLQAYDKRSVADLLRHQGASEGVLALLQMEDMGSASGQGIKTTSALFFLRNLAYRRQVARSESSEAGGFLPGGNDQLPRLMAARLGGRVHYGAAVFRIEHNGGCVRAIFRRRPSGRQESMVADRLVCALPFSVLRSLEIDPPFPTDKRRVISQMPYAADTCAFLQVRRRFWDNQGFSGKAFAAPSGPTAAVQPPGQQFQRAVLEARYRHAEAAELGERSDEELLAHAASDLARMHPELSRYIEGGTTWAWGEDPWARGGYSFYRPGQMMDFAPVARRPEGRVHFAGAHTSRLTTDADGAVASGRRVAREIEEAAEG